jgi:hypothetical protein
MKTHFKTTYPYSDCDIIEREANNRDFTFFIPFFEGQHYTTIIRCWIEDSIHFLYLDTSDVFKQYRFTSASKELPYRVFRFLMNSPLWPNNTSVFWSQLPVVEQTESECGFRTLLHAFILSQTKDPYYCLQPLHSFGGNTIKNKRNIFYNWTNARLSTLCREWVKEVMYKKCWVVKDWMKALINNANTFKYTENWTQNRCVEIACTDEKMEEIDIIIKAAEEESDVPMKAAVQKANNQPHPFEKEAAIIMCSNLPTGGHAIGTQLQIAPSPGQKDQSNVSTSFVPHPDTADTGTNAVGHSIGTQLQIAPSAGRKDQSNVSTSFVPHPDTADTGTNAVVHSIGTQLQISPSAGPKYQSNVSTSFDPHPDTADTGSNAPLPKDIDKGNTKIGLIAENNESLAQDKEEIDRSSSFALDTDISVSKEKEGISDSTNLDSDGLNIRNDTEAVHSLTTGIDKAETSVEMTTSNDAPLAQEEEEINKSVTFAQSTQLLLETEASLGNETDKGETIIGSRLTLGQEIDQTNDGNSLVNNTQAHVVTEKDGINVENNNVLGEPDPTINENLESYIEDEEDVEITNQITTAKQTTTQNQKFNSWKGPRRVRQFTPRQKLKTYHEIGMLYCGVCKHTVTDKYKCSQCSEFIHKLCGFVVADSTSHIYTCKDCFESSDVPANTKQQKRLRVSTTKDTELSSLWLEKKKTGKTDASESSSTRTFSQLPPIRSLEEQIREFNKWLSQVHKIQYRVTKDGKKGFRGCFLDGSNIGDIYDKYLTETLFENEQELLRVICSKENRNKWYTLPTAFGKLIRQRGRVFSDVELYKSFDLLEQHMWSYMKYNTYKREEPQITFVMIDQQAKCRHGTYYISLATADKQHVVQFVPKYYILRWMHFCSQHLSFDGTNEYDNTFEKARKYSNRWVEIDAGAQKRSYSDYIEEEKDTDMPHIFKKQSEGEFSCVFSSLISAFHYINDYTARDLLSANLTASLNYSEMCEASNSRAGFASKLLSKNGYYSTIIPNFNVITDVSLWPTLCILRGSDNSVNHAITVVQGYIFDSNKDKAMYISQQNLDWCCSSENSNVTFTGVVKAYRFIKQKPLPQHLIRDKDDVEKAIQSAVRVFYSIQDRDACTALELLKDTVQPHENFMTAIVKTLNTKPFRYKVERLKESSDDVVNSFYSSPAVCLITNQSKSLFTVISIVGSTFFDGSRSPPLELSIKNVSLILTKGMSESEQILRLNGYEFIKRSRNI